MALFVHETPERPYELTFEVRPEYLHARIAAPKIDRTIALDCLAEIAVKCAQTRRKKVLLERDINTMMASKELFETTEDFVRMDHGLRIALVNPHPSIEEGLRNIVNYVSSIGGVASDSRLYSNLESSLRFCFLSKPMPRLKR